MPSPGYSYVEDLNDLHCILLAYSKSKIFTEGQTPTKNSKMKSEQLGIEQEIEVWPFEQMVSAQHRILPGEWGAQTPQGFREINGSSNHG